MNTRTCAGLVAVVMAGLALLAPVVAVAQSTQPPGQEDFVPAGSLPPAEQLPAAPLVIGAYAFVWVAVLVYVWSLWRRLRRVEQDLADLQRRAAGR